MKTIEVVKELDAEKTNSCYGPAILGSYEWKEIFYLLEGKYSVNTL